MALTDTTGAPPPKRESILPLLLRITTVGVIIAGLYVGWTFYSRHQRAQETEQAIQKKQDDQRKRVADQIFGSGEIKFSTFSISTSVLKPGETTQLCYGVVNATRVKLDPAPPEPLKPSYRHCFDIAPRKTTTYTITASNDKGESQSQSLTLRVQ
ncbi:MAG: hypothetical protein ACJ746_16980 [Bryobacteraceae bacterium]